MARAIDYTYDMQVGIPRELKVHEYRVAITPPGVRELIRYGHTVFIERNAGIGSAITDSDFLGAGAVIVESADELWARCELILKVKEPIEEEYHRLRADQVLFTFLHLAASKVLTQVLCASGTTAIAYETVEVNGRLPLLAPMSEVAGRMASQVAAHLLEREQGGKGKLMGGVPGVAPARVIVLGAGMAGQNAARVAHGMGAEVIVVDTDPDKLRAVDTAHQGTVRTLMSSRSTIEDLTIGADVVIGTVLVPGAKAPKLVDRAQVEAMQPGTVLIDVAIDQGGCFETSHVTTHAAPTFVVDDVVHYCVGNMPGAVPHTSTYALANVTLPYVIRLAEQGISGAAAADVALKKGVNVWNGQLTNQAVAEAHDLPYNPSVY